MGHISPITDENHTKKAMLGLEKDMIKEEIFGSSEAGHQGTGHPEVEGRNSGQRNYRKENCSISLKIPKYILMTADFYVLPIISFRISSSR